MMGGSNRCWGITSISSHLNVRRAEGRGVLCTSSIAQPLRGVARNGKRDATGESHGQTIVNSDVVGMKCVKRNQAILRTLWVSLAALGGRYLCNGRHLRDFGRNLGRVGLSTAFVHALSGVCRACYSITP